MAFLDFRNPDSSTLPAARNRGLKALFVILFFSHLLLYASSPVSKEYQIKAAFLFNFAQFVEWPSTAFENADTPICIGILGADPFGSALDETVRGETVRKRKLIVLRSQRLEDLKNCHMIFISKSEESRLQKILEEIQSKSVLTVSETPDFANRGGILNFYLDGNKVRFEINPAVAQRKNLKLSSELLNLGKIVKSDNRQ